MPICRLLGARSACNASGTASVSDFGAESRGAYSKKIREAQSRARQRQLRREAHAPCRPVRRVQHLEADDHRAPRRHQRRHHAEARLLDRRAERRKDAAAIDDGREYAGPSRFARRRVVVDVERRDDERRVAAPEERDLMIGDRLKAGCPYRRVGRPALHVPELPVRRASVDPATRTRARRGRS